MLSNTCDARRICRLLGYTKHIRVIIMVRERDYKDNISVILYITSQLLRIYNVLQRGYKVIIIYFLESLKVFRKFKSFRKV